MYAHVCKFSMHEIYFEMTLRDVMKKSETVFDSMIASCNCHVIHCHTAEKADRNNLLFQLLCIAPDRCLVYLPSGQIDYYLNYYFYRFSYNQYNHRALNVPRRTSRKLSD